MLDNQDNNTTSLENTPTNTVANTPVNKKKPSLKLILGGFILLLMVIGSGAALYLTQINQDVRQQASETPYPTGSENVETGETYTPSSTPVSCSGGKLCNCAPNDLCKPIGSTGTSNSGPNGQTCFLNATGFQCVKRATVETIVSGGEGGSCEIGQRTACGSDGCDAGQQRLCGGGANGLGACVFTDRCIGDSERGNGEVSQGQSCEGLKRVSGGEPSKGGFVGCSGKKNCFCQGSINTGSSYSSGTVVCYDDYQNDSCGAPGVGGPPATQPPVTQPPVTQPPATQPPDNSPNPSPTPQSSPNPSPTPTSYYCNSTCETNSQCQTNDANLICSTAEGNRCRLNSNPSSAECQPAVGPMCLDIDLVDAQTGTLLTEDPSFGDSIKFNCAEVDGVDHYIFRVIEPDDTIVNLAATGRTSASYTINKDGKHFAQCQICTTSSDDSCNSYEALN